MTVDDVERFLVDGGEHLANCGLANARVTDEKKGLVEFVGE